MIPPAMLSFLETYCKCSAQFKFSSKMISKYLVEVSGNNFLPSMSRTKSCCWCLLLFEYNMQCVLSKFKESLLLATHDFTFFNSFSVFALCVLIFRGILVLRHLRTKPFLSQCKLVSHLYTQGIKTGLEYFLVGHRRLLES